MPLLDELKDLVDEYSEIDSMSEFEGKYKLSSRSLKELQGVKLELVAVVKRAIELTTQDFAVHDGIRTLAEQKELVKKGASQTLKSKHITGDAVDLVPYVNGKLRWEWEPIYKIAEAVRKAAKELNVSITWGGNWYLTDFKDSSDTPEKIVSDYVSQRKKEGKKAFIDGPHFQLN